ncbi:MAG: hypothetical protein ACRDMV_18235 [Streptosporangiales bacterium]
MGARNTDQSSMIRNGREERRTFGEEVIRHLVPWMMLPLLLLVGFLAHLAWGSSSSLPLISAVMGVAVTGVSLVAWTVAARHHVPGPLHIVGTVAAAGMWIVLATVIGPVTHPVGDMLGLLGAFAAFSWNVRIGLARPTREDGEAKTPGAHAKALLSSLGVKGAKMQATEVNEARIAGTLQLDGQSTVEDAQKRAPQLATALQVPKAGVRFTEDPTNAGQAQFTVALRDVLKESTPWPGPSAVRGTAFDPIPMGLYETGEVMLKTLADADGAKHELTQGITGSGKSSGTKIELAEDMTRRELGIIVIDPVKGLQSFGRAARGLSKLIIDEDKGRRFLERLPKVIRERADYLGAHGYKGWQPGCGLTYLVVQVEEASTFLADMDDDVVKSIVKAARSVGISVKISLQRPSFDEISTTVRSQLGTVTCYGIGSDDAVCMLPENVQNAGADPRQWGDTQPGCCYIAGTGLSAAQQSTPLRTYDVTDEQLEQIANTYGPHMDPIDEITTAAFGTLWARLGDPVELVDQLKRGILGKGDAQPASNDGAVPATSDNTDNESDDTWTVGEMKLVTPDPAPEVAAAIDDEVTGLDVEMQFGPTATSEVATEDARRAVADRIAEIEQVGNDVITVPDLFELVRSGMRSRSWFRKELLRLVEVGRLTDRGGGEFGIVPTGDDGDVPALAA